MIGNGRFPDRRGRMSCPTSSCGLVDGILVGAPEGLHPARWSKRLLQVSVVLLGSGTAICGGSAIAAVAPAIGASPVSTAVSLSVVFVLNGVALFLFPWVGHLLDMTQQQFGLWAALAIHDACHADAGTNRATSASVPTVQLPLTPA